MQGRSVAEADERLGMSPYHVIIEFVENSS